MSFIFLFPLQECGLGQDLPLIHVLAQLGVCQLQHQLAQRFDRDALIHVLAQVDVC